MPKSFLSRLLTMRGSSLLPTKPRPQSAESNAACRPAAKYLSSRHWRLSASSNNSFSNRKMRKKGWTRTLINVNRSLKESKSLTVAVAKSKLSTNDKEHDPRKIISWLGRAACPRADWVAFNLSGGKPPFPTCEVPLLEWFSEDHSGQSNGLRTNRHH